MNRFTLFPQHETVMASFILKVEKSFPEGNAVCMDARASPAQCYSTPNNCMTCFCSQKLFLENLRLQAFDSV